MKTRYIKMLSKDFAFHHGSGKKNEYMLFNRYKKLIILTTFCCWLNLFVFSFWHQCRGKQLIINKKKTKAFIGNIDLFCSVFFLFFVLFCLQAFQVYMTYNCFQNQGNNRNMSTAIIITI